MRMASRSDTVRVKTRSSDERKRGGEVLPLP